MLTLLLLACAAHSPRGASAPAATAAGFRYDAASGRCLDAEGREGRNTVAIEQVRATRDAQCADLRGVQLLPPSTGDLEGMLAVLADDVTLYPDSGGKLPGAARRPIHGSDAVARLIAGGRGRLVPAERTILPATINGQPGFVIYVSGRPLFASIFEIRDHRIQAIYGVGNPDKLQHIPGVTA